MIEMSMLYVMLLQTKPCGPDRPFKCKSTGQCIINSATCNRYHDCADGSDEDINFCKV